MRLRKWMGHALAIFLCASAACSALARPAPSVPELSYRLQAMAQRQAKLFLQLRLSVDAETSQRKLDEAIRAFDAGALQLAQMRAANGSALNLESFNAQWTTARATLNEAADPVSTAKAAKEAERLVQVLKQLADQNMPHDANPAFKLSILAARDAMLVQRLAKIYLQLRAGDGELDRKTELAQTRKEFLQDIDTMERSPLNQAAIRSNIDLVRQQWEFFETAMASSSVDTKAMRTVVSTSERIGQALTDVTMAYLGLAEQNLAAR